MQTIRLRRAAVLAIVAVGLLPGAGTAWAEAAYHVEWIRQIGTQWSDSAKGVRGDSWGNSYVAGGTQGNLGADNVGWSDAYLQKYDSVGNLVWARQFGTTADEWSASVALDSSGNALVTGPTTGGLAGANAGGYDVFAFKYDTQGNQLWSLQTGTSADDLADGVAADPFGNCYIVGRTRGALGGAPVGFQDVFVQKHTSAGALVWSRQFGSTKDDFSAGIATDANGNSYIGGWTLGDVASPNVGGQDIFLRKYDADGNPLWTTQTGTSGDDRAAGVAVDAQGNSYITGWTNGDLAGPVVGGNDAFLLKYSPDGNLLWSRLLGTSLSDLAFAVAVDAAGGVYFTGETGGDLGGPNANQVITGVADVFLSKFGSDGTLLWSSQLGSPEKDRAEALGLDGYGRLYLAGHSYGDFGGWNSGYKDGFVLQYTPEPGTLGLLAVAGLMILRRR